jgi:hypothetical protein
LYFFFFFGLKKKKEKERKEEASYDPHTEKTKTPFARFWLLTPVILPTWEAEF